MKKFKPEEIEEVWFCHGKRAYHSEGEAIDAMLHQLHKQTATKLRYYKCSDCGCWHLTSLTKSEYERVKKK